MQQSADGSGRRPAMARRDFLSRSVGTAAAGTFAFGTPHEGLLAKSLGATRPKRLEVRYVVGSDTTPVDRMDEIRLVDAAKLASGDASLAPRTRVLFQGFDKSTPGEAPSVALYVHLRPFHKTPFLAWGSSSGECSSVASPSRVDLPVDPVAGLNLSFDFRESGTPRDEAGRELTSLDEEFFSDHSFVRFATGTESRVPKLRRGVYAISWGQSRHVLVSVDAPRENDDAREAVENPTEQEEN